MVPELRLHSTPNGFHLGVDVARAAKGRSGIALHSGLASASPSSRSWFPSTFSSFPSLPSKENAGSLQLVVRCSNLPNPTFTDSAVASAGNSSRGGSGNSPEERKNYLVLGDFTRLYQPPKDRESPELQTAIVTYVKPRPWWDILHPEIQVDLVAAVHIADKEYFLSLQEELDRYDRVLYEMVVDTKKPKRKTKGTVERWRPQKQKSTRKGGISFISFIQKMISQFLRLDFQLEHMDYAGSNWYHADLDLETFKRLQKEKGENFFSFAKDVTIASFKTLQNSDKYLNLDPFRKSLIWMARFVPMPLLGLFLIEGVCSPPGTFFLRTPEARALLDLDLVSALKVFLAKQLTADLIDGSTSLLESSVIIGERNAVAMNELEKAISDNCKKIAIFYGSGHLPDLDRRLRDDLGMVPVNVSWRTAWYISGNRRDSKGTTSVILNRLAKISGWPLNRYQTLALVLFSVILAADLLVWEFILDSLKQSAEQLIILLMHILDQGWGL